MHLKKHNPSFLIVKMSALGDIIQCFGVVGYLKRLFPEACIDWIVERPFAPLLEAHPDIRRVFVAETKIWRRSPLRMQTLKEGLGLFKSIRKERYDAVFDLQANTKSSLFTFLARSIHKVGFQKSVAKEWPNVFFTNRRYFVTPLMQINKQYLSIAQQFFRDPEEFSYEGVSLQISDQEKEKMHHILQGSQELRYPLKFMVCPGSNWKNKKLREETLKEFLNEIRKKLDAAFLFIWGNSDEKLQAASLSGSFPERSIVLGKLHLATWQNMMAQVDCVISMDSSPLHLCATTKTPSFSIFGPSSAEVFRPYGEKHFAFQGQCPYGKTFEKRCALLRTCETGSCIRDLSPHTLAKAFLAWWHSPLVGGMRA